MANIQFGGLITGLDVNALITGLAKAEHGAADILLNQKTVFQVQQGIFASITGALANLKSSAASLSLSTDFNKLTAASSDSTVVTAAADSSGQAGSTTILVDTLAKAQSLRSTSFNNANAAIGSGTLTITVGTTSTAVVIDPTNNTLAGLKSAINSSGAAASASIVNVGTSASPDYRLILQSKNTGIGNAASISGTLAGGSDPFTGGGQIVQAAADAIFSVNGLAITRGSNTVSDVVPGVTFTLLKEGNHDGVADSADAAANLTVTTDSSGLSGAIQSIVDSYNAVNKIVNDQFALDPNSKRQGALAGDSTVRNLISRLRGQFTAPGGDDVGVKSISDIGLSFQRDGSLKLDAAKLTSTLASDPTGVKNLFALVQNGLGKRIPDTIDSFIKPVGGSLTTRQQGLQNNINRIDQKVASEDARITALQDRLTQQFSNLEKLVSQLKSQGDFLTQQLGALSTQVNYKSR